MATFKLEINGDLGELIDVAHRLACVPIVTEASFAPPPFSDRLPPETVTDADVLQQAEDNLTAAFAQAGRTGHSATDAAAPAADKPKRTRKATTADAGPATGAETFAEQIKEVVASEAAANPTSAATSETNASLDPGPTSSSGESPAASDAAANAAASPDSSTAAATSATDPAVDYKAECQTLVKKLMGDSRYSTKDLLDTLESFGGKGVSAIADSNPGNLPALFDKLTGMAAV